jgi:glycosyltransferase involved in cell wall biosynthesis
MIVIAAIVLFLWLAAAAELVYGARHTPKLTAIAPADTAPLPRISIIIAARNEAAALGEALASVLRLDYPHLDIIAVDDRSTDATGQVLDRFAASDSRLKVLHINALPRGWLGKNHALAMGAEAAAGDWLLFTDADIIFAPDVLRRAVALIERQHFDHLAVSPDATGGTPALKAMLPAVSLCLGLSLRPWRAVNPASRAHCGIGAFNLVRRRCYLAVGGHGAIALRPDDDIKLGRLLKRAGYRQGFAKGGGLLRVSWYPSARAMFQGLEKNSFAFFNYRFSEVLGASILFGWAHIWPFAALAFGGLSTWLGAINIAFMLTLGVAIAREIRIQPAYGLVYPLAAPAILGILWNSMVRTLVRGGIVWRDTFYPLRKLAPRAAPAIDPAIDKDDKRKTVDKRR